jgi:hypothetical protein
MMIEAWPAALEEMFLRLWHLDYTVLPAFLQALAKRSWIKKGARDLQD